MLQSDLDLQAKNISGTITTSNYCCPPLTLEFVSFFKDNLSFLPKQISPILYNKVEKSNIKLP